jgi:hypothetical protein
MTYQPPPNYPGPHPPQVPFKKSGPWWLWPLILIGILAFVVAWAGQMHVGEFGVIVILLAAVPIALVVLIFRALARAGNKQPPTMVIQQPAQAALPPGWYTDPAGLVRWFDGQQWTDQVQR